MFLKLPTLFIFQLILVIKFCDSTDTTVTISLTTEIILTTLLPNIKRENCTQFSTNTDFWFKLNNETNYCYYLSDKQINYYEANDFCLSKNGSLVSIHSEQQNSLLSEQKRIGEENSNNVYDLYWIGLNSLKKRSIYEWSDKTPGDFFNFHNHTIGDPMETGRCVRIKTRLLSDDQNVGIWYKYDCTELNRYICQRKINEHNTPTPPPLPPGNCLPDWYQYSDRKCIKYVTGQLNYTQAKDQCSKLNAEILSIHSETEQALITALIGPNHTAYIGFRRTSGNGKWKWDDQSLDTYTNWGYQSDDFDCAVVATNLTQPGKWFMSDCNQLYSVLCQMSTDTNITTPGMSFAENQCKISGFNKFIQYQNSCYLVVDNHPSNFLEAESQCNGMNGSHLVSIVDPFEQSFLKYLVHQFGKSDTYWIGLQSTVVSDKNVSQVFEWTDQWPVYETNWDNNEPRFAGIPRAECVSLLKSNSSWRTDICDATFAYICKTTTNILPKMDSNKSGVCPDLNGVTDSSFNWVDIDRRSRYCYWFSVDKVGPLYTGVESWSDASYHCRRRNGTLASIHSNHELMLLKNKLIQMRNKFEHNIPTPNTWIGLFKNPIDGQYIWEDGTALDFTNWNPKENIVLQINDLDDDSGHQCVEVDSNDLTWKQMTCSGDIRNYYICAAKKVSTQSTVSPTLTPISNKTTRLPTVRVGTTTTQIITNPLVTTVSNTTTKLFTILVSSTTQLGSQSTATQTHNKSMTTVNPIVSTTLSSNTTNNTTSNYRSTTLRRLEYTTLSQLTSSGTTDRSADDSDKHLSTGVKIGISVGIVGGILVLIAIIYIIYKRFQPNSRFVKTVENSIYSRNRTKSSEPSVRWSKRP